MIKSLLPLLLFICFTSLITQASPRGKRGGNEVGNGGIVAFHHNGMIQALDFEEYLFITKKLKLSDYAYPVGSFHEAMKEMVAAHQMLDSLTRWGLTTDETRALKKRANSLFRKTFYTTYSLRTPYDFNPEAAQIDPTKFKRFGACILQSTKTHAFKIDIGIWSQLSILQKATLIVHETWMNAAIEANAGHNIEDSAIIRELTAATIAARFHVYLNKEGKEYWKNIFREKYPTPQ